MYDSYDEEVFEVSAARVDITASCECIALLVIAWEITSIGTCFLQ
jgi:hypothetical protein